MPPKRGRKPKPKLPVPDPSGGVESDMEMEISEEQTEEKSEPKKKGRGKAPATRSQAKAKVSSPTPKSKPTKRQPATKARRVAVVLKRKRKELRSSDAEPEEEDEMEEAEVEAVAGPSKATASRPGSSRPKATNANRANTGSKRSSLTDAESEGTIPSPPAVLSQEEAGEVGETDQINEYIPLNIDLREEFMDSRKREEDKKQTIKLLDMEYRNKKVDPLRAELYKDLLRFFKKVPLTKMKAFLPKMKDKNFTRFIAPNPDLKNSKALDKKNKIQKLMNFLCTNSKKERTVLYSMSCRMTIAWIVNFKDKEPWTAFRLKKPKSPYPEDIHPLEFSKAVGNELETTLQEIEDREYVDRLVKAEFNTFYYVHCKLSKGICYIAVRMQQVPGRRASKRAPALELATTIIFAVKPNLPHLFVHGKDANPDERIMKIFTKCLRFRSYEHQQLSSKDLDRMIEQCSRRLVIPDVAQFTRKFEEEEKVMNERGAFYVDRAEAQRTQYQCAMIQDGQAGGVGTYTLHHKLKDPKRNPNEPQKYSACQTTIKLPKGVNFDDFVVDLYKRGAITNLQAFMKMKATQSNFYQQSSDEEAEEGAA